MYNKYSAIKQLVDLWETFEEESGSQDFSAFADWLLNRREKYTDVVLKPEKREPGNDKKNTLLYIRDLEESFRFMEYVSRISRLHEFYVRKFFSDLPVNSRLEYLFLYTVSEKERAKKTELINIHFVDYTTGMDTIKRMIRNGLLEEAADETDKRAKLLKVTEEGRAVLLKAGKKLADEINMFLSCISMNKWKKTLPVFEEINEFHTGVYLSYNDKNAAELMNLIDSLKHLYK